MSEMPTDRSGASASSRRWPTGSRLALLVVGVLVVSAALTVFVMAGDKEAEKSNSAVRQGDAMLVMDDFESGALTGWQAVGAGSGGWFVYSDGQKSPDPARADPNVAFDLPDPPQGKFAVSAERPGPDELDALIACGSPAMPKPPEKPGRIVLLTSGTTGTPKGAPRPDPKGFALPGAVLERMPMRASETTVMRMPLRTTRVMNVSHSRRARAIMRVSGRRWSAWRS